MSTKIRNKTKTHSVVSRHLLANSRAVYLRARVYGGVYGLALRGAQYAKAFRTNQQIYPSHGNMTPSEQSGDGAGSSIFQTSENRLFFWCLNMYEIFDAFLCSRIIV